MKSILQKISLFILGVLLVICPFGIFLIIGSSQPHVYSKTYYAALVDKVHNLEIHKKDKKIILVGGSNVAFGFNSELLEKEFPEYKVVNFGLYAMLGTKIMMDLTLDYVNEGDVIILTPEINSQSTSLFFDAKSTLKALEDDMKIINKLADDNRDSVYGNYFEFVKDRKTNKEVIEPTGVYQRKNFNSNGDILYQELDENGISYRSRNRMELHYDPTMLVDFSYKIDEQFFDYVNDYSSKILKKKASIYYSFSPVNEKAVVNKSSLIDYYWSLRQNLICHVIGNPNDYIIDAHYFYDSNFHLNDSGAIYRSYLLAQDIYRDIKNVSIKPSINVPDMPEYIEGEEFGEDSVTAPYFDYVDYEGSLLISGVKNAHINDSSFELPSVANHKRVVGIANGAFAKCTMINNLHIGENIKILMDGCFGKCESLLNVYIDTFEPGDIIVSFTGNMTDNVTVGFKLFIHSKSIAKFAADYYWGAYSSFFVGY